MHNLDDSSVLEMLNIDMINIIWSLVVGTIEANRFSKYLAKVHLFLNNSKINDYIWSVLNENGVKDFE